MARPVEEQFGVRKAKKIRKIQNLFQSLQFRTGAAPYYRSEIVKCLDEGLLLAATHVATALLELFTRDLLVIMRYRNNFSRPPKLIYDEELGKIEKEIEDGRPRFDFSRIISELVQQKLINPKDGDKIYDFYKNVRIPLHHGLTRRFVRISSEFVIDDEDELLLDHRGRSYAVEEIIEDNALKHLTTVGDFIKKYLPMKDGLYSG